MLPLAELRQSEFLKAVSVSFWAHSWFMTQKIIGDLLGTFPSPDLKSVIYQEVSLQNSGLDWNLVMLIVVVGSFLLGFSLSPISWLYFQLHPSQHQCSCMHIQLFPTLCNTMDCSSIRLLSLWELPGKNARADCHSLLQGLFLTQELNLSLLHCKQFLDCWATRIVPNWAIIVLQCCIHFCCTMRWISNMKTYIPSILSPPTPPGQGGLVCCDSRGCKESDPTEQLNWTEPLQSHPTRLGHHRELTWTFFVI